MTNINGIAFRESETEAGKVEVGLFIGEEYFAGFNIQRGEAIVLRAQLAAAMSDHVPITADQRETLKAVLHRIHEFNELCEEEEYTDSGDLWEIVGEAYNAIDALFTPTKEPAPPAAWCPGCYTPSTPDCIGAVCHACKRSIVEEKRKPYCEHEPITYTKHPSGDIATKCRKCFEPMEKKL